MNTIPDTSDTAPGPSADAADGDDPPPRWRRVDAPSGAMRVELIDSNSRLHDARRAWLLEHAQKALEVLGAAGEVRVRLVNDTEMVDAHHRSMGKSSTTDVLTFDLASGAEGALDVDLLVCADEAQRQADRHGHSVEKEVLLYVVHGVLHCVGYDDHDEAEARRMHAREDEVLTQIGVGPIYDTNSRKLGEKS